MDKSCHWEANVYSPICVWRSKFAKGEGRLRQSQPLSGLAQGCPPHNDTVVGVLRGCSAVLAVGDAGDSVRRTHAGIWPECAGIQLRRGDSARKYRRQRFGRYVGNWWAQVERAMPSDILPRQATLEPGVLGHSWTFTPSQAFPLPFILLLNEETAALGG